jgi:hypothetical protein
MIESMTESELGEYANFLVGEIERIMLESLMLPKLRSTLIQVERELANREG